MSVVPTAKARSRTKKRLLEIKDHLQNLDTVRYAYERLEEAKLREDETLQKLIKKMISLYLIDDYTSPAVLDCLIENIPAMNVVVERCARGNGLDLLSRCLQESNGSAHLLYEDGKTIAQIFELGRTNYTTAIKRPEEKCIFWTFSIAFFLLYVLFVTGHEFLLPAPVTDRDMTEFFEKYPEFLIRSWDAGELLQFRIVMQHMVSMYGNGNNKACLVEMVTRVTRGREIALTCNTSGGAMKKDTIYSDETEVAAECCRVRIYQRESGVEPRRRDHSLDDKNGSKSKATQASRGTAVELSRIATSDFNMIAGLTDAFEHDTFEHDVLIDSPIGIARPATKRIKSAPEAKVNIVNTDMPRPRLERRHSSDGQNSGIESILAAAAGNDSIFDVLDGRQPDMSRTISEDIAQALRSSHYQSSTVRIDDNVGSLLYPGAPLTRVFSNSSTASAGSLGLPRIPPNGAVLDCLSPDDILGRRPMKCSRVTSQDWAQYPYNQLK